EKLNFKALRMGPVGIDVYGARCHGSGKMVKFLAVPSARCSSTVGHFYLDLVSEHGRNLCHPVVFVQATVDGGSETGELYAAHVALRQQCMSDISLEDAPAFVALKSTDNSMIESSWHLFTNYVGLDIKQVIFLGKTHNYFHPSLQLHIELFNWLWPQIIQCSLDDFVEYWNDHRIWTQRNKLLPSGVSPYYIYDFPEQYGLTNFTTPVATDLVEALRENIPKSREECYRWVSDEFQVKAWAVYDHIGAPKLELTDGWTIFCRM
ncbi:hypothetical protein C8F04DRAFT_911641, partial [Mycena alexandri]